MYQDPYKVLGVSPNATNEEVKAAWDLLRQGPLNYGADGIQGEILHHGGQCLKARSEKRTGRAGGKAGTGRRGLGVVI
mgnify:CR=1 FL=1